MLLAFAAAALATTPRADAGLFGGKAASTPTPSPSPSAIPTATPEPPEVAIPRLQAKLKANPNDEQSLTELASQFLSINRPDLSVQLTQRLLQLGDKTAQVYYLDGFAQQQLGNMQGAVAELEQASNLDPTNLGVLAQLSDLYLRVNRPSDAERIAKRAVTFNKTNPQAYITLGGVYAAEQHYDDARAQYEQAATMDPKDITPLYQIAQTYAAQNNIPMAIQSIGRALTVDPSNVQALVFKADQYAHQHDDVHAAAAYDDAVVAATTEDQKVAILTRKAAYYDAQKKTSQAEGVFQQMIAQYPKNANAHIAYGDYYAESKQMDKAQQEWQAALAIDKDNAQALLRLGQTALQAGKMTDAITYLKHATDVAPDAQSFALLGQAYSFVHNYEGSKDACSKSFQIERSPQMLGCIAGADYELKNYKEAAQIADVLDHAARGFLDQNPQLLFIAGKSYQNTNQKAKAVSAYKRLLPMMKKGTKDYNQIEQTISELSKPDSKPPTKTKKS